MAILDPSIRLSNSYLMYFEVYQDSIQQKWHFQLKNHSKKVLLKSKAYATKQGCLKGVAAVKRNGKEKFKYSVQVSSNRSFKLILQLNNYRVIATSPSFSQKTQGEKIIQHLLELTPSTPVHLVE